MAYAAALLMSGEISLTEIRRAWRAMAAFVTRRTSPFAR